MNRLFFPDYQRTIMNVSNSILKHYHCHAPHPTIPELDQRLNEKTKHVVLLLIDGMGEAILDQYPHETIHLRNDHIQTISSVFPSTTVSATTSVLTGLPPSQTAWLGWTQYFSEEAKHVILFTNRDYYDQDHVFDYDVAQRHLPYETIYEKIRKTQPSLKLTEVYPAFRQKEHTTFQAQVDTILATLANHEENFVYGYWDKLDYDMHEFSPSDPKIAEDLAQIDAAYHDLTMRVPENTVIITIADHGQVSVEKLPLYAYPDILETFSRMPSIESRATAFAIKPEHKERFVTLFHSYFKDDYLLYSRDEVMELELFGPRPYHPKLQEFIGDYLAIAVGNKYFHLVDGSFVMKGQHAGVRTEEMLVPLIVYQK
ncbi:MAG: alkaline phosphatase family protein [Candidatus Izemoplasmatales bacterium]|nr:alkaline phosphatase family protein [Candidatus Izemoplasmatales bacterium]MDD5292684.1 alkaline phosphatase family protein [Candidatus Izemoplasmatales bacterium]